MTEKEQNKHEHKHLISFKGYLILYFIGLALYLLSLLISPVNVINFDFDANYILIPIYFISLILSGAHVVTEGIEDTIKKSIKHKRFKPNVHILMTVAAIGAIIIGHYHEAVILILIFAGAHFLEDYIEGRSSKEIQKLLNLNPKEARLLLENGETEVISTLDLKVGDKVRVLNGDEIPSDGVIIEGSTELDEATITGESVPAFKTVGDTVFGSTINKDNAITVLINKNSDETVVAKIIELVSNAQTDISDTAKLINKIEPIYVTIALLIAPIFYFAGVYLFGWTSADSLYKMMVYLIGVSPCALAVTDIPATLAAISNLARHNVLIKGGSYLSNFSEVNTIAFDKTGTLTNGKPVLTELIYLNNYEDEEKKLFESIIYSMESNSNHPLALAVINYFGDEKILNLEAKNLIGIGLETNYKNNEYLITKPTNNKHQNNSVSEITEKLEKKGHTVVHFVKNNETVLIMTFIDEIKETSLNAIKYFEENNIQTVMITGDSTNTANEIGSKLNINKIYAEIMPEDKLEIIKELKANDNVVVMVGDGVNDAPALTKANIGFAMNSGTDIAIEAADGILIKNDLNDLAYAHNVAKKLRRNVIQNIIFAMGVVVFLIIMNFMGSMEMPLAVVVHEGSTILVILNGLRLLKSVKMHK